MLPELLRRARPAALVLGEYVANGVYGLGHRSLLRCSATASERHRRLPGDDLLADPDWQATRAETIHAPAKAVWPWLVQLGYGRGGYYGDLPWWKGEQGRGVAASADRVLPELQHLDVGDVLLDGANCDATRGAWTVSCIEPERSLVLFSSRMLDGREVDPHARPKPRGFFACSWAFVLVPEGEQVTRLLVRSRIRMVPAWALHGAGFLMLGDTVMQRAMLRGIKQRVERTTAPADPRFPTVVDAATNGPAGWGPLGPWQRPASPPNC
jgi:hypothetical protein